MAELPNIKEKKPRLMKDRIIEERRRDVRSRSRSLPPQPGGANRGGEKSNVRSSARGKKISKRSKYRESTRSRPSTQTTSHNDSKYPGESQHSYLQPQISGSSALGSMHVARPSTDKPRTPKSKLSPMSMSDGKKRKRRKSRRKGRSRDVSPRVGKVKESKGDHGRRSVFPRRESNVLVYGGEDEKILCMKFFPTDDLLKNHKEATRVHDEHRMYYMRGRTSRSGSNSAYSSPKGRRSRGPSRKREEKPLSVEGKIVDSVNLGVSDTKSRRKSSKKKKGKKKSRNSSRTRSISQGTPGNEELSLCELGVYEKRNHGIDAQLFVYEGQDSRHRTDTNFSSHTPIFIPQHRYFYSIQNVRVGRSSGELARFFYHWAVKNDARNYVTTGVRIVRQTSGGGRKKDFDREEKQVNMGLVKREHFITSLNVHNSPLKDNRKLNVYGRERKRWGLSLDKLQEVPNVMSYHFTNHDQIIKRVGKMGLCKHMYFNFLGDEAIGLGLTEQYVKKLGGQKSTVNTTYVIFNPVSTNKKR